MLKYPEDLDVQLIRLCNISYIKFTALKRNIFQLTQMSKVLVALKLTMKINSTRYLITFAEYKIDAYHEF